MHVEPCEVSAIWEDYKQSRIPADHIQDEVSPRLGHVLCEFTADLGHITLKLGFRSVDLGVYR